MKQLIYTLQFKGKAAPNSGSGNVLKATTSAQSCTITTIVGPDELEGKLQPIDGGRAQFESEVTLTDKNAFQERGSIAFGKGRLYFTTVGQGYLGPSPDPKLQHGSVIWKIDRGEGQFEGATGLITSNFFVSEAGDVTDNHFGVIFVK